MEEVRKKPSNTWKVVLAIVSLIAFTYVYNIKFAIILMATLGFHEYGHLWAMNKCGLKTKGFYFIPLVGGIAIGEGKATTRAQEVFFVLAGPIFGLAMTAVTISLYQLTQNPLWATAAWWMALVNFFNLVPIHPLDGGRFAFSIASSINKKLSLFVKASGPVIAVAIYFFIARSPVFLFLAFIGYLEFSDELSMRKAKEMSRKLQYLSQRFQELGIPAEDINELLKNRPIEFPPEPKPLTRQGVWTSLIIGLGLLCLFLYLSLVMRAQPSYAEGSKMLFG